MWPVHGLPNVEGMNTTTKSHRPDARIRVAEVTMSILVGMIIGTLVVLAVPTMPMGAVLGVLSAVVVGFSLDLAVRRARRAVLAS